MLKSLSFKPDKYKAPTSIREALRRRKSLIANMAMIKQQIGSKHKLSPNGKRMTAKEYWAWRGRTVAALGYREAELRMLNEYVKTERALRRAPVGTVADPPDLMDVVRIAYRLLNKLSKEVTLDREELRTVQFLKYVIDHH